MKKNLNFEQDKVALPLNLTGNLSTSLPLTENSKEYITYTLIISSKHKIDVAWQLPKIHIVVYEEIRA